MNSLNSMENHLVVAPKLNAQNYTKIGHFLGAKANAELLILFTIC